MKAEEIRTLLEKYYQGETSLEEEKMLRAYLQESQQAEFEDDRRLFSIMDAGKTVSSSMDYFLPHQKIAETAPVSGQEKIIRLSWATGIAAAMALLILGIGSGVLISNEFGARQQIAAIQEDLREVKELTALHRLHNESASGRILAAYEISRQPAADEETLNTLIATLLTDKHVNVRIAAADALFKFGDNDQVRKAFIDALGAEIDPNLQIRLIDMLVRLDEKRALPELQKVMENEEKLNIVRNRAAQGLAQLL